MGYAVGSGLQPVIIHYRSKQFLPRACLACCFTLIKEQSMALELMIQVVSGQDLG